MGIRFGPSILRAASNSRWITRNQLEFGHKTYLLTDHKMQRSAIVRYIKEDNGIQSGS